MNHLTSGELFGAATMTQNRYQKAQHDVGKVFDSPQTLADASDLSTEQKIELLSQWEIDLREMLVASEENMPSTEPGNAAELLRKVRKQLNALVTDERDSIAPGKAGAW